MAGSRGQLWTSTSWILALKTTLGLPCFEDLRALGREIPSQKELVRSLLFQPTAENCCETLGFGGGAPPQYPPFAAGQMACPGLAASLAGAAAAEVRPLPIPAPRLRGMEQDPAPSPGKMQGGTCPTLPCERVCPRCLLCLQSRFLGGNHAYFYRHIIYYVAPAQQAAAPIAAASRRSNKVPLPARGRAPGICQKLLLSCKASAPSRGCFWGDSIHHLVMKNPFYLPERSVLLPRQALGQTDPSRCVIHSSGEHHPL